VIVGSAVGLVVFWKLCLHMQVKGRCVWVSGQSSSGICTEEEKQERKNKRQESSIGSNSMVVNFSESAIVVLLWLFLLPLFLIFRHLKKHSEVRID